MIRVGNARGIWSPRLRAGTGFVEADGAAGELGFLDNATAGEWSPARQLARETSRTAPALI